MGKRRGFRALDTIEWRELRGECRRTLGEAERSQEEEAAGSPALPTGGQAAGSTAPVARVRLVAAKRAPQVEREEGEVGELYNEFRDPSPEPSEAPPTPPWREEQKQRQRAWDQEFPETPWILRSLEGKRKRARKNGIAWDDL